MKFEKVENFYNPANDNERMFDVPAGESHVDTIKRFKNEVENNNIDFPITINHSAFANREFASPRDMIQFLIESSHSGVLSSEEELVDDLINSLKETA